LKVIVKFKSNIKADFQERIFLFYYKWFSEGSTLSKNNEIFMLPAFVLLLSSLASLQRKPFGALLYFRIFYL